MGCPWREHPSYELVTEASDLVDRDVAHLLEEAPVEELTRTANAQLATFVMSLVVLDALERLGVEPSIAAGHSLGEYSALVASGALSFEEGLRLVTERGEAMQDATDTSPGTMVAVMGIGDDAAQAACQRTQSKVWVANYNAPGHVVLAGTTGAIEAVTPIAKSLGARKVIRFPVAGAFHTPLMAPARARLRKALAEASFEEPEIPVVANVDASVHTSVADWPELLSAQLCSPVRWHQSVATMIGIGARTFVEVGPGGVLTGLGRRLAPEARSISVSEPEDLDRLVDALAGDSRLQRLGETHPGEHLFISERIVVSPAAGVFTPIEAMIAEASPEIQVGDQIGWVGDVEVYSPFGGTLAGFMAMPTERVTKGQPVAWLRAGGA